MLRVTAAALVAVLIGPCSPAPSPDRPAFTSTTRVLADDERAAMVGVSWHPGCPVPLEDLRAVELTYWGMDDAAHTGTIVVHHDAAAAVSAAFAQLYAIGFPLTSVEPIEGFDGDDDSSTAADNTSGFNCRPVEGTTRWSMHAFGRAVDLNPCRNPYVRSDGSVKLVECRRFADRDLGEPGMIHAGDLVVAAFAQQGWGWGGQWRSSRDYQHFSANGR